MGRNFGNVLLCRRILGSHSGGYEIFILWDITPCIPLKVNGSLFFDPEDGGDMFLRNVGWISMKYTALYPRI
jgi:hypothetical protein